MKDEYKKTKDISELKNRLKIPPNLLLMFMLMDG